MSYLNSKINKIGWRFDNSYAQLPETLLTKLLPAPVEDPKLILLNHSLAKKLDLDFSKISNEDIAFIFSGNNLPEGSESLAQAYAGHQFGFLTMLGDGRATLIGEHLTSKNSRVDIQLKGSGKTPYSRGGDGRATLGPMLREYIISEAMHALKIPTSRGLAVVSTGQKIVRDKILPGAILTRVASSHLRIGTFQYLALKGDIKNIEKLVNYSLQRHYPNLIKRNNRALTLLKAVIKNQIELIVNWMRVGFIHGVMNTDNMTISGETIDYGPCAFMDIYNPKTVFSSIDHQGRYTFINQSLIGQWNLAKFAETLIPLLNKDQKKSIKTATEIINNFNNEYQKNWLEMMRKKLGFFGKEDEDENIVNELLLWMQKNKADYTNTFYSLISDLPKENIKFKDTKFKDWFEKWKKRISKNKQSSEKSIELMRNNNPYLIPRNHNIENALNSAVNQNDFKPIIELTRALNYPYKFNIKNQKYNLPPKFINENYKTFCGT